MVGPELIWIKIIWKVKCTWQMIRKLLGKLESSVQSFEVWLSRIQRGFAPTSFCCAPPPSSAEMVSWPVQPALAGSMFTSGELLWAPGPERDWAILQSILHPLGRFWRWDSPPGHPNIILFWAFHIQDEGRNDPWHNSSTLKTSEGVTV